MDTEVDYMNRIAAEIEVCAAGEASAFRSFSRLGLGPSVTELMCGFQKSGFRSDAIRRR